MRGEERRRKVRGFTLIELSIVLIIIGLLLAAVIKGRDLIRSAQLKKMYNQFVKRWETIYTQYYDRTGRVLGGPLIINSTAGNETYDDYVGWDVHDSTNNNDLGYRNMDRFTQNGWITQAISAAGIEVPEGVRRYINGYDFSGSRLGRVTMYITFGSDPVVSNNPGFNIWLTGTGVDADGHAVNEGSTIPNTNNVNNFQGTSATGNFMLIINVPYDVAAQIDKIIDGVADGQHGNVICVGHYNTPRTIANINSGTSVIDTANIQGIDNTADCGGPFHWGNSTNNKYVTMLYKLEF